MTDHTAQRNYSIAVDFDGVIHSYKSKWVRAEVIPDSPVPGAIEWLNEIGKHFRVIIFTTRGKTLEGRNAVRQWLCQQGMKTYGERLEVTAEKPPALIYLDDRAVRFDGKNFPTADQIHRVYIPWNKFTTEPEPSTETVEITLPAGTVREAVCRFKMDGYIDDQDEIYTLMHALEDAT